MVKKGQAKARRTEAAANCSVGAAVIFSPSRAGASKKKDGNHGLDLIEAALRSAGLAVARVSLPANEGSKRRAKSSSGYIEKEVRSALERLTAECGENASRIAVLAEGDAATAAVLAMQSEWRVRSFVLLSARLSEEAKQILADWKNNPTFSLVSSEDKRALRDSTHVHFASTHADSDIRVFEGLGSGSDMIESWLEKHSDRQPLETSVAEWVRRSVSAVGREREVSFMTEDGWNIFGNLLLPDSGEKKAPGIILLHSGRSDRYIFARLERLLVRAGFAVLNIDWRGRGKSINKGSYFELSKEERANGKLDAKAAIDFLASQNGVDPDRIGMVGVIHGAEHAARSSIGDPRVKAIAVLTGYIPADEKERAHVTSGNVHILYITCEGHRKVTEVMRKLYKETPGKLTRLIVYEGGAIGYQLFELDDQLEPTIVEWLKEGLTQ